MERGAYGTLTNKSYALYDHNFEKHTAPEACSKHAPGAICISHNGSVGAFESNILSNYYWFRTVQY